MAAIRAACRKHRLRADASRNRERIVTAARDAFVEHGPDIPLDEIARRADVGNATLYRNFADRRALVRTVTLSVMDRTARQAEAALAEEPDGFAALQRFVHRAADERIGALCTLFSGEFESDDSELTTCRSHLTQAVDAVVEAAHRSGRLRSDVVVGDVVVALSQLTRPLPGTADRGIERSVHRHLQLYLDGLRAPGRSALPGPAADLEELRRTP